MANSLEFGKGGPRGVDGRGKGWGGTGEGSQKAVEDQNHHIKTREVFKEMIIILGFLEKVCNVVSGIRLRIFRIIIPKMCFKITRSIPPLHPTCLLYCCTSFVFAFCASNMFSLFYCCVFNFEWTYLLI